jgi:hypothetical protein
MRLAVPESLSSPGAVSDQACFSPERKPMGLASQERSMMAMLWLVV